MLEKTIFTGRVHLDQCTFLGGGRVTLCAVATSAYTGTSQKPGVVLYSIKVIAIKEPHYNLSLEAGLLVIVDQHKVPYDVTNNNQQNC